VIRTPTNNKLRMEDKRGEEHIKLSTEYGGKTQLNLGHNVDASRALRGEGAELRTDKWVSIRGGAGVFISADKQPSAGDRMLAMEEAIAQLENALGIAKSLASAAESAQALPSDTGNQQTLNDALKELAQPGMVLNAPQGVSISSPQTVRLSSGSASVGIMSQQNTDISAMKRFTVAAGEAVSLLARKAGMKLFAAKGKVAIQAQDDALEATAKKDITVTSVEGRVEITAAKELVVNCGGAYIKLSGGNIEIADPQNILFKSTNWQKMGSASLNKFPPRLPGSSGKNPSDADIPPQTLRINVPQAPNATDISWAGMPYTLYADGAIVKQGVLDKTGKVDVDHKPETQSYRMEMANGVSYQIPIVSAYRNKEQGKLANRGLQHHSSLPDSDINSPASLTEHRNLYDELLNGSGNKDER
ncbi:DUF2345 domain-containing protein, partial [Enterobacter hormaechei]